MVSTMHKSLTITFLAVSIFISGINVDFVGAQNTAVIKATSRRSADPLLSRYLRFGRLTTEDGLSNNQTYHIAQDNHGFMWFATANGLNRYDGSSVKVYRHDPDDAYSLGNSVIRSLIADQSGVLWIGTWGGGLNQYDREKDAFIRYQHDPDDPYSLSNNSLRAIYEDRNGTIWVGTHGGLNKLDRETKQFTHYLHDPDDPNSLSHNLVWSILEDRAGVLWVGTEKGFNRFDPKTEQFIRYRHDPDDPASLSHNRIRAIYEDRSGILWLSTHRGLTKFNRDRNRFTRYLKDNTDPQTLSSNLVTGVYEDRAGRLWVSTWGGGLNRFERETETFTHYRHDPADPYSLSADTVFQVYEDQQGMFWIASIGGISIFDGRGKPFQHYRSISHLSNTLSHNVVRALHAGRAGVVWVGTSGGGLNKFDRQTETFTHYRHDPADPNSLSNDTVRAIYEDRMGLIWVGTSQGGLNRFDPATERFTLFRHDAANPGSIGDGPIMGINEDRTGTLWIASWGGGLNAFDRETEQFTRYQHDPADPHTLSDNQVINVLEDRAGELWIGTMGGGLNKFNREAMKFTRYQHVATDPHSLGHNAVISICEDRTGTLWLGTIGGLDKFDRKNDQFVHYTTKNGLPSDPIMGILEDEQGRLWLSTPNGLSRFDPRTESFRNYTVSDGLQSNTFLNFSSYSKSQSGEMFFGGSNGFNAFYPDQIEDNPHPPPVLITDFQLANKPVPIGADSVLKKTILETDKLVLSYRDRVFSFEFVVLNYRAPEQNRYKYRMDGFEKEWTEMTGKRRFVTYTNLDPGDYVFRVIGSNNDGVWNEEGAAVRITVTPPWWETMWFRISMVVVVIALLAGGFRWRVRGIEARRRELEIQVERMTQIRQMQAERDRILEVSQDMICIAGMDGNFKYLNPAWEKNLGYTDEDLMSKKFMDFVHPDDRAKTMREFESLATGHKTVDFENRYIHMDGSIRHLSWMATPLPDEKRVYAVARDITARKQAEEELKQSKENLARAQEIAHIGSWQLDIVNDRLWWSDEAYRIFGVAGGTPMTYEKFIAHVHPEEKTYVEERWLAALKNEPYDIEHRIIVADEVKWVHEQAEVTFDEADNAVSASGTVQDITERKLIDRKYRTVADFTYDWEYWLNMDGTLEYVSPSCERISGYSVKEFMENPSLFRDIIVPEDRGIWDQHMNESVKDLTFKEVQFRIKKRDGNIRWIEHANRPVLDDQGRLDSFRASNRDITIRKQVEISLQTSRRKAEALASSLISTQEAGSARLARELHDDINQRLAFLKIEVDKLEMKNQSLPEPARDKLRQIARDIGVLSSDIHLISRRLHPVTLEILGLVRSIETECQNFTRLNEIPVTLDLDGSVEYPSKEISLCTYRILQEGLRNIVRHAKATGVHVTLSKKNDILHLLIKDNGTGFDPASDGVKAGLGIASMTERARLLRGNLSIESRPGKGTAIKLAMPLESRNDE